LEAVTDWWQHTARALRRCTSHLQLLGNSYCLRCLCCLQDPKACTIVLRGASKDVLNEVERNLHVSGNLSGGALQYEC
jgi:hypothetical protein